MEMHEGQTHYLYVQFWRVGGYPAFKVLGHSIEDITFPPF